MNVDVELYIDLLQQEVRRLRTEAHNWERASTLRQRAGAVAGMTGTTDDDVAEADRNAYRPPRNMTSEGGA